MIACHGIGKSYGHFQVLHDVNLTIAEGECFALFGPNGAGKTTLLNILATLQRQTDGAAGWLSDCMRLLVDLVTSLGIALLLVQIQQILFHSLM